MKKGHLFIISGPSGVGKNTVAEKLLQTIPQLHQATTCTTRKPRPEEIDGIDYHFLSEQTFLQRIEDVAFLEWAKVHAHHYGTPKQAVIESLERGDNVLLIIDIQGALQVKNTMPKAHMIFLEPESIDQLKKQIEKRGHMDPDKLALRLKDAETEIANKNKYDHVVMNKDGELENTVNQVIEIIESIINAN